MRYITSTSSIVIYRVDITSESRGISIENIIEALISQLGPDKVGFLFTNSQINSYWRIKKVNILLNTIILQLVNVPFLFMFLRS